MPPETSEELDWDYIGVLLGLCSYRGSHFELGSLWVYTGDLILEILSMVQSCV